MDCQDRTDQLLFYAAGALEPDELDEVRRHLATGCPACAGVLSDAQATLALIPMGLEPVQPSVEARTRLLKRVEALGERAHPQSLRADVASVPRAPWWAYVLIPTSLATAAAALIALIVSLQVQRHWQSSFETEHSDLQRKFSELTALMVQTNQTQMALNNTPRPQNPIVAADYMEWPASPRLLTLDLAPMPAQAVTARARIFWDVQRNTWHFYATGLNPPSPGRVYELWFVSSNGKMVKPAGSFMPGPGGIAELNALIPPDATSELDVAAVTDEDLHSDMSTPKGSFQLKGAMAGPPASTPAR